MDWPVYINGQVPHRGSSHFETFGFSVFGFGENVFSSLVVDACCEEYS
jgi:hypothetical protein